jgi:hypothetical protein
VLSRLISLLRRIPAVKWAFTRLRPLPHSGSIDAAPIAADAEPAIDVADASPSAEISVAPSHDDAATVPVALDETAVPDVAENASAAPSEIDTDEALSREVPISVDPVAIEAPSMLAGEVEGEPVEIADHVVSSDASLDDAADDELFSEEAASVPLADALNPAAEVDDRVVAAEPSSEAAVDTEPVGAEAAVAPFVEAESADIADLVVASEAPPEIAADAAPASGKPALAIAPPASKPSRAPKKLTRAVDPADRATLIRQRWAQTGVRMWNPRLHGTGDATLNIQGRIELLPPEPGDTMPRYDKLEFKMLGGQIVCEGIIVEASAHASQRSFTRLAEPRNPERVREPMRERQAALA